MKKLVALALVIVSILALASVALAEHNDVGGVGVKSIRTFSNP